MALALQKIPSRKRPDYMDFGPSMPGFSLTTSMTGMKIHPHWAELAVFWPVG